MHKKGDGVMTRNWLTGLTLVLWIAGGPALAHEVDLTRLPPGDGRIAGGPTKGSIYACRSNFNPNAPGAYRTGDWMNGDGTFDLTKKATVDGNVRHVSDLSVLVVGDTRKIRGNALPKHPTGQFPIAQNDEAYNYDRNPNSINAHRFEIALPVTPQPAVEASCVPMGAIGIMLTGGVLFNALDARGDDALAHEVLDTCGGHPQRTGLYHTHGKSPCQSDKGNDTTASDLLGYAFDGFGIYGPHDQDGTVVSGADLDECHGHVSEIEWDGATTNMYHYHATQAHPYTLGCFKGTPVKAKGLNERMAIGIPGRNGPPRGDRPPPGGKPPF